MYQEGIVNIIKCSSCGVEFADFTFVADSDMVTYGCIALTSLGNKIILTMSRGNESINEIESRISSGYKILSVRFKKGQAIYSCISCGSDAPEIKTESKEEFLTHGEILVINDS